MIIDSVVTFSTHQNLRNVVQSLEKEVMQYYVNMNCLLIVIISIDMRVMQHVERLSKSEIHILKFSCKKLENKLPVVVLC